MQPEIYRKIEDFPTYEVSNYGKIRNWWFINGSVLKRRKYPKLLKIRSRNNGYKEIMLCKNGSRITRLIHRLVLEAFAGPCPEGMQGCHNDGSRGNNHISNLRWGTRKENAQDRKIHGTEVWGERQGRSKLKNLEVIEMRRLYKLGVTITMLSKMFKASVGHTHRIVNRACWRHI